MHVPLKSTGEAINEVLSGRAHAVIAASIGALGFSKDSRIRLIGVTSPKRSVAPGSRRAHRSAGGLSALASVRAHRSSPLSAKKRGGPCAFGM